MKRLPLILTLLASALVQAWAQDASEYPLYAVYADAPGVQTPAPAGYEPFYISYCVRHGSRYLTQKSLYDKPYKILKELHESGALSAEGETLYEEVKTVRADSKGREGQLTPMGAREHAAIMERMCAAYPEVFGRVGLRVEAFSSDNQRTIDSKESALKVLSGAYPGLEIVREPFTKGYFRHPSREYTDSLCKVVTKRMTYKARPERFIRQMLKAPESISEKDAKKLMEGVWELSAAASMRPELGVDLARHITADEARRMWAQRNIYTYLRYGPSELYGEKVFEDVYPLMRNIVAEADSVLAGAPVAANMRFIHDSQMVPISALLHITPNCTVVSDLDRLDKVWDGRSLACMAMNVQLIFYRNPSSEEILVKVLFNENEAKLQGVRKYKGPYYRWSDLREKITY